MGKPDIFEVLKKEHRKVQDLISQIKDRQPGEMRQEIFRDLDEDLKAHSKAEERLIYPILLSAPEKEGRVFGFSAEEEHKIVENILNEMEENSVESDEWNGLFHVLSESVHQHIDEEESKGFVLLRKMCDKDRRAELADEFVSLKDSLLKEDASDSSRKEPRTRDYRITPQ
ncbi:hemerythrin domain-containing protein [bacterium]|nr:hemerythrin domain-containing protein [bacterium]